MNYPVWDVAFGAGLLIALVAILHVFVSHFAVGGGLFLVLTERKARRNNDVALLHWLKSHTKFFVLVTVVYGAVSGVGIWFTIGLISPMATSNLIHAYVWGWAIEWVFFFVEITAALLYLYGWEKLEARLHEWYGWVYFIAAFASMVIINGIITFMLTSGRWIQNHEFWAGFFNPTYFPSLAFRFAISLALAGIYALITASVQKDAALKARIVRWSAVWIVPSLAVLPALGWWYIRKIPAEVWASARGPMPTGTHFALLAGRSADGDVCVGSAHAGQTWAFTPCLQLTCRTGRTRRDGFVRVRPRSHSQALRHRELSLRELPVRDSHARRWRLQRRKNRRRGGSPNCEVAENRELTKDNQVAVGREVFRVECESCHTTDSYRGVKRYLALRQWDQNKIQAMLSGLDLMHNGVMPPFAGTDSEREALAAFLTTIQPVTATPYRGDRR